MAVMSDGSYGIPKNICFSFPVVCKKGTWEVVKGLKLNEFAKQKIETTTKELSDERKMALEYLENLNK